MMDEGCCWHGAQEHGRGTKAFVGAEAGHMAEKIVAGNASLHSTRLDTQGKARLRAEVRWWHSKTLAAPA